MALSQGQVYLFAAADALAAFPRTLPDDSEMLLMLDERMNAACAATAETLASRSAFLSSTTPFYLDAAIAALPAEPPTTGRCLEWAVGSDNMLYVRVQLDAETPSAHILLGSLEQIDVSMHAAFLRAVEQAFPITETSTFACFPRADDVAAECGFRTGLASAPKAEHAPYHAPSRALSCHLPPRAPPHSSAAASAVASGVAAGGRKKAGGGKTASMEVERGRLVTIDKHKAVSKAKHAKAMHAKAMHAEAQHYNKPAKQRRKHKKRSNMMHEQGSMGHTMGGHNRTWVRPGMQSVRK